MFSPVGYVPALRLWSEFLQNRLDAVYADVSAHYESEGFDSEAIIGSPLDICEHLFLRVISSLDPMLAAPDGRLMRFYVPQEEAGDGLFALVPPYRSSDYASASELENEDPGEIARLAGRYFEAWSGDWDEPQLWSQKYPQHGQDAGQLPRELEDGLRFCRLPLCIERDRYIVAERLPHWAKFLTDTHNAEVLIANFAGWSVCVAEFRLEAWNDCLSGKTPLLPSDFALGAETRRGRPSRRAEAAKAYQTLFPDGHTGKTWKMVVLAIEQQTGGVFSIDTLKRALGKK